MPTKSLAYQPNAFILFPEMSRCSVWRVVVKGIVRLFLPILRYLASPLCKHRYSSSDAIKAQEHLLISLHKSFVHLKNLNSKLKMLVLMPQIILCVIIVSVDFQVFQFRTRSKQCVHLFISYLLCICNKNHKIFNKININLYSAATDNCCLADDFPWCSSA